eukprot:CCRYP_016087-RB/>CCRYP_016087-RB protein AED:0.24 eAED:0.24 QI:1547/1/1/1/0.90/0.83/12/111/541
MGKVDSLDSNFELKQNESRRKKDSSHSSNLPIGGRPTWLSKSVGNVEYLESSLKLAPQKKPNMLKHRKDVSQSLSTPSRGPTWLSKSTGNTEYVDNLFNLEPQKTPKSRQSISHSFSNVSGGRPDPPSKSIGKAKGSFSFKMAQGDEEGSSKRRSSRLFNLMVSKKRVTEQQATLQTSHCIGQEHTGSVRHRGKRKIKVHDDDNCRSVNRSLDFCSHYDAMDIESMICKNINGDGPSQRSQFTLSFVSDFSDAGTLYESKTENEDGQFRLSFVSDLSDASGLSGIRNYDTKKEGDIFNDAQEERSGNACQVSESIIAAFSQREKNLRSPAANSTPFHLMQLPSSFLPLELTYMNSYYIERDSYLKSSFLSDDSSERSVFSADFTVTGLFLDDTSLTPNSVNQYCTYDSFMSTNDTVPLSASYEEAEDDSHATFPSQELEDDSAVGICGSPLSSDDDSSTYNIHTKNSGCGSNVPQPRRSTSKTVVQAVAAMFKGTNSQRSECDLALELYKKDGNSKNGVVVKDRNSKGFAFDFSAWEKRHK